MELDKTVMAGVGGLLAGVVLTYAVTASGRADLQAQLSRQDDVLARIESLDARLSEGMGALDERIAAAAAAPHPGIEALGARLEQFGGDLGGRLEAVAPAVRQSLSEDLGEVRTHLAALAARGEAGAERALDAAAGREANEASVAVGDPAAATGEGQEIPIGGAAVFGDGAARVFLSSVDPAAQTAQVAVNGFARIPVALGGSAPAGDCTVVMTALGEGTATFDSDCGGEAQAAAATAGGETGAGGTGGGAAAGSAHPHELRIGQTAIFADGEVRVFLSSVNADAGTASISLNGAAPAAIALNEPMAAGSCKVTLISAAAGTATIEGAC